jgi:hypothetical protein
MCNGPAPGEILVAVTSSKLVGVVMEGVTMERTGISFAVVNSGSILGGTNA